MASINLTHPGSNIQQSVSLGGADQISLGFNASDAVFTHVDNDLVLKFNDGATLELDGFYEDYHKDNLPSFIVNGQEIKGSDFFAAMNDPDLMPAAGPEAQRTDSNSYHEYDNMALASGISHLDGLDYRSENDAAVAAEASRALDQIIEGTNIARGMPEPVKTTVSLSQGSEGVFVTITLSQAPTAPGQIVYQINGQEFVANFAPGQTEIVHPSPIPLTPSPYPGAYLHVDVTVNDIINGGLPAKDPVSNNEGDFTVPPADVELKLEVERNDDGTVTGKITSI